MSLSKPMKTAFLAIFLLGGCEFRPKILSAEARQQGDHEFVGVEVLTLDAAKIKRRQLNFFLIVENCKNAENRSALDAQIAGERVAEFRYPLSGEKTKITAVMPANIFFGYKDPCVKLEGGGYVTGTLRTDPFPVARMKTP